MNYADFTSVPPAAYYLNCNGGNVEFCKYNGTRYTYGADFINGIRTADFGVMYENGQSSNQWIWDAVYTPKLLVPLQIRHLDTAWSTCSLDLVGMYDPPRALTQAIIYPTPTMPTEIQSPTQAKPGSKPTSNASPTQGPQFSTGPPSIKDPQPTGASRQEAGNPQKSDSSKARESNESISPGGGVVGDPSDTGTDGAGPTLGGQQSNDPAPLQHQGTHVTIDPGTIDALTILQSAQQGFHRSHPSDNWQSPNQPDAAQHRSIELTMDGQAHTIVQLPGSRGVYEVDSTQTFKPGQPAITVDGLTMTAGSSGTVIAGSLTLAMPHQEQQPPSEPFTFTANGEIHTIEPVAGSIGVYEVDGSHTITQGAGVTEVDGITISVASFGRVVANSRTITVPTAHPTLGFGTEIVTANDQEHTIVSVSGSSGVYVVDGSYTLTENAAAITVDGMKISAASSGEIVAGCQTVTISSADNRNSSTSYSRTSLPDIVYSTSPTSDPTSAGTTSSNAAAPMSKMGDGAFVWLPGLLLLIVW